MERTKQSSPFKKYDSSNYKEYEKKLLNSMIDDQLFDGIGTSKDILGKFVDRVLERSLYVYRNRNCHTCSQLLSKGMSTQRCPKCHHLLRDLYRKEIEYLSYIIICDSFRTYLKKYKFFQ